MAVRALPPGAIRKRAVFGLLDASGWTWAFIKALFWFLTIIFLLGYIPDRAYYFTVSNTVDISYNAIPIVNLCDPANRGLPCPAPAGAVVPWEQSPEKLVLPEPRAGAGTFGSGERLYLIGGRSADGAATDQVLSTRVTTNGNFAPWTAEQALALPEPRTDAAIVNLSGVPYVIGGADAAGNPTATVFRGVVDEGALTGWESTDDLALPQPLTGVAGAPSNNGIYLFGGRGADGPVQTVYRSAFDTAIPPNLGAWEEMTELPLPEARADATAAAVGSLFYVLGGEGPNGVSNEVFLLLVGGDGAPQVDAATNRPFPWRRSGNGPFSLPEPRASATTFSANGAIYVLGGVGADGETPAGTNYWSVPNAVNGDIPEWRRLDKSDLPAPRADAAVANVGSFAFLIGGEGPSGVEAGSLRANLSPTPPFFRLGLFGMTVPALSIKGEIGQQLGYINAFGVGMTNFAILVVIGYAMSHRRGTARFLERVTRGRYRAPREEEYQL